MVFSEVHLVTRGNIRLWTGLQPTPSRDRLPDHQYSFKCGNKGLRFIAEGQGSVL